MKTATYTDIIRAIESGRLRVDPNTGIIEGRRPNPKAVWRTKALEKVQAPHQKTPYYRTSFVVDGQRFRCLVHRLVWIAINGPIPEELEINHKNGDKTDNRLDNLELLTSGENIKDAYKNRLNRGPAKLTDDKVRLIREQLASGERQADLARRYGVSFWVIRGIKFRKSYCFVV